MVTFHPKISALEFFYIKDEERYSYFSSQNIVRTINSKLKLEMITLRSKLAPEL